MSLLQTSKADLASILADSVSGFSESVTLTDPDGVSRVLPCHVKDCGLRLDADTGVYVSGRSVCLSFAISNFTAAIPEGEIDPAKKPWTVLRGLETFHVVRSIPDYTIGFVDLYLSAYAP